MGKNFGPNGRNVLAGRRTFNGVVGDDDLQLGGPTLAFVRPPLPAMAAARRFVAVPAPTRVVDSWLDLPALGCDGELVGRRKSRKIGGLDVRRDLDECVYTKMGKSFRSGKLCNRFWHSLS